MIYVYENSFNRQLDFLEELANIEDCEYIVWFYPEEKEPDFLGVPVINDVVEGNPVTSYANDYMAYRTKRSDFNLDVVNQLRENKSKLKQLCDSVVIYKKGSFDIFAFMIEHEGMCAVDQDDLFIGLQLAGYNATIEAEPDGGDVSKL